MAVRVLLALVLALAPRVAHAGDCDPAEAKELREHLTVAKHHANQWNWGWRIGFTGAAVATAVVGYANPFPSLQHGMYGSAGKAAVGALARWILPLKVNLPAENSDACADIKALRLEVARLGHAERNLFWLGHIGGLLVNLAGAAYVYYYDGLGKAALSVGIGYPVGLLSNYTMPRASWHLWRERESAWSAASATVTVLPTEHGWQAALVGTF